MGEGVCRAPAGLGAGGGVHRLRSSDFHDHKRVQIDVSFVAQSFSVRRENRHTPMLWVLWVIDQKITTDLMRPKPGNSAASNRDRVGGGLCLFHAVTQGQEKQHHANRQEDMP